ncbi:MAG: thrombospondin type 3 repeat-containing protein [Chloroflexi bacterium]|nr:thrombospondin type 3 repeat-containing protein [Chloroflexota bacterium]
MPNVRPLILFAAILALLSIGSASGAAGDTTRVSGDFGAIDSAISDDGRYVAFASTSSALVPGDTNGLADVFVRDRLTGETTRVSVDSLGNEGDWNSSRPEISGDGRYVAFRSGASNLVANDTNGIDDVFVHDRQTGSTTRISVSSAGAEANGDSDLFSINGDGRYVAFQSFATTLLDGETTAGGDIFVHDLQTSQTTRVSVDSLGTASNGQSGRPSISDDGRYVAFDSKATNLVAGDTNARDDVFVHDRQTGLTTRVSVSSTGVEADDSANFAAISGDGRYVAFDSKATTLVAGDTGFPIYDVFVHDLQTGATVRASVDNLGDLGNNDSRHASINSDGRLVAFDSYASDLVPGDTNGRTDVFVRDLELGLTFRASVSTQGTEVNHTSEDPALSADGKFVAFESYADGLVADDTNGVVDVFVRELGPPCELGVNPNDLDCDFVDDAQDNCPGVANPGQTDNESDGVGDACDPDDDNDTFYDVFDNCPVDANPLQEDADSDGIGDACEVCNLTPQVCIDKIAIDLEEDATPANTPTSLGTIETCRRMRDNDVLDYDEDAVDRMTVDVVAGPSGIGPATGLIAFAYTLNFNGSTVNVTAVDNEQILGSNDIFDTGDLPPDSDGLFYVSAVDVTAVGVTGPGVMTRLEFEAVGSGLSAVSMSDIGAVDQQGLLMHYAAAQAATIVVEPVANSSSACDDADGDGISDVIDNCVDTQNPDQANHDGGANGDACDLDDDNAGVLDLDEIACAGDPIVASVLPERVDGVFAGVSDDGDTDVDEALPPGAEAFDCDGDGYTGTAEAHVFGGQTDRDQDPCGTNGWPSELNSSSGPPNSFNRINVLDITSFLAPVRYFGTDVGTNPGDVRWDLTPGKGVFLTDINVQDITAMIAGSSGNPPMLHGAKAFGGPQCPWAP